MTTKQPRRVPVKPTNAGHRGRFRALAAIAGPLVLLAAVAYHPYIANLMDNTTVAPHITADVNRWAIAHIMFGVGSGLVLLAFLAVRVHLRDAGEDRWSARGTPFVAVGSVLFAMLPAMEIGVLAGALGGADPLAAQNAVDTWFLPVLLSGAVLFAIGSGCFVAAVARSHAFGTARTPVIGGLLAIAALTRFVPLGAALYVGAIASLIAFTMMAPALWRHEDDVAAERAWAMAG